MNDVVRAASEANADAVFLGGSASPRTMVAQSSEAVHYDPERFHT